MNPPGLVVCAEPLGDHWQLGALAAAQSPVALIGWAGFPSVDAGVPIVVAAILARTLCSMGKVTFLASEPPKVNAYARPLSTVGLFEGLRRRLGVSDTRVLVTTLDPGIVPSAFVDAGVPWWQQSQVLLCTAEAAPVPEPTAAELDALMSNDWCAAAAASDLLVVGRPGVDGDLMGLCARDVSVRTTILEELSRETRSAGLPIESLGEGAFAARLAD
jgi:hypothetical protein